MLIARRKRKPSSRSHLDDHSSKRFRRPRYLPAALPLPSPSVLSEVHSKKNPQTSDTIIKLRNAFARQQELDEKRQGIEVRLADPSLCSLVTQAIRETVLRSLLRDREKARACMKNLLFGINGEVVAALTQLSMVQSSQQELLQRCEDVLAFEPLVSKLETYARDRNFSQDCTSYCLDLGIDSWVRIKSTQNIVSLGDSPLFQHFDGCSFNVTRTLRLAHLSPTMTGPTLFNLFQPVAVSVVRAEFLKSKIPEMQVVVEVGGGPEEHVDAAMGQSKLCERNKGFRVICYGYRTYFPKDSICNCDEPCKTWACGLPPACQRTACRHLVGMIIPISRTATMDSQCRSLDIMFSIVT